MAANDTEALRALADKWREPTPQDDCTLYTMGKRAARLECADRLDAELDALTPAPAAMGREAVDGPSEPTKPQDPRQWFPMDTAPRDGTVIVLRWGQDGESPGWWLKRKEFANGRRYAWAFIDGGTNGRPFVNHAVDTEYGPTHWTPYTAPGYTILSGDMCRHGKWASEPCGHCDAIRVLAPRAEAVECEHDWVTDGVGPTQCVRCGVKSRAALAGAEAVDAPAPAVEAARPALIGALADLPEHVQKCVIAYGDACARIAHAAPPEADRTAGEALREALEELVCAADPMLIAGRHRFPSIPTDDGGIQHSALARAWYRPEDADGLKRAVEHARSILAAHPPAAAAPPRRDEDAERLDWLSDADNAIEIGISGIGIGQTPAELRRRIDSAREATQDREGTP